jgi:hypothetical protein
MILKSIPFWIFLFLLLVAAIQIAYYTPRLPDKVASHFASDGTPNGWSSKTSLITVYILTLCIITVCFPGTACWIHKIPVTLVSMPYRDYWLAPKRREASFLFIARQLVLLGCATNGFVILVFNDLFQANLQEEVRGISHIFWVLFALYMAYTLYGCIRFFIRFNKPKPSNS